MKRKRFLAVLTAASLSASMALTAMPVFAGDVVSVEASDAYVESSTDNATVTDALKTALNAANLTVTDTISATGRSIADITAGDYTITDITVESVDAPTYKVTPTGGFLVMPLLHMKGSVKLTASPNTPYGTVTFTAYSTNLTKTEEIAAAKAVVEGVGGTDFDTNVSAYKNDDNSTSVPGYVQNILTNTNIKLANYSAKSVANVLTDFQTVAGSGLNGDTVKATATQGSITKATKQAAGSETINVSFRVEVKGATVGSYPGDPEYDSTNSNKQYVNGSASYTATIPKIGTQSSDDNYQTAVENALKDVTFTNADFGSSTLTDKKNDTVTSTTDAGAYTKIQKALANVGVKEWANTAIKFRNVKEASHKEDGSVEVLLDASRTGETSPVQYATVTLPITHADDVTAVEPEVAAKLVATDGAIKADSVAIQAQNSDKASQKKDAEAAIKAQIEKALEDKLEGTDTIGSEIDKVEASIADADFKASTADTTGSIAGYSVAVTYKNALSEAPAVLSGASYTVALDAAKTKVTYTFSHADPNQIKLYKLSSVAATGLTLNDSYSMNSAAGELKITPTFTPANANKYLIRWTLKSKDKFNVKANSAYADYTDTAKNSATTATTVYTKNEALDLVDVDGTTKAGDSVEITAQLIDSDGLVAATAKTTVKYVNGFDDVQNTHDYAYNAINYLSGVRTVQKNDAYTDVAVITGTGNNMFTPDSDVTRAQFLTFLYRLAQWDGELSDEVTTGTSIIVDGASKNAENAHGEAVVDASGNVTGYKFPTFTDSAASTKFTDVDANAYYAKAVDWAVANGITSGKTDTTFAPNAKVTRAEAVTFLYRYFAANQSYNAADFTDVANTAYYANAVGWASSNGVTQGKTATTFAPNDTTTRKEAAAFIYRATNTAKINK